MTPRVLVVTAGGLARETLEALRSGGSHDVVGILDEDVRLHGTAVAGVQVLGGLELAGQDPDVQLVVCAGRGAVRAGIVDRLAACGVADARFAAVIHHSVVVPGSCVVGRGSVVLDGVSLTSSVSLGRHVVVMPHAVLTHDDAVGDFVTICAGVVLGGHVRIEREAYVGMAASIREGVTVGRGATVGMGAVVLHDVPPGQTWAGNPARRLDVPPSD